MNDEKLCTQWIEVTPTREATRIGLRIAFLVFLCAVAVVVLAPFSYLTLGGIMVGLVALGSLLFDLYRWFRPRPIYERFEFDDRRLEQVRKTEESELYRIWCIAYDALERVSLKRGTIGFYERGQQTPEVVLGTEHFPNREMLVALLTRIAARDIVIEHVDDTLDSGTYALPQEFIGRP
jgi:hypothetical protein